MDGTRAIGCALRGGNASQQASRKVLRQSARTTRPAQPATAQAAVRGEENGEPTPVVQLWRPRLAASMAIAACLAAWVPLLLGGGDVPLACGISVAALGACGVLVRRAYRTDPALARRREWADRLRAEQGRLAELDSNLTAAKKHRQELEQQHNQQKTALRQKRERLQEQGRQQQQQVRQNVRDALALLETRRKALNEQTMNGLKQIQDELQAAVTEYNRELEVLTQAGTTEAERRLESYRTEFVARRLLEARIVEADIPGLGKRFKERLQMFGVETAADVSEARILRIEGFGPNRARTVVTWRETIEQAARKEMPRELPEDETREIVLRYHKRQKQLETEKYTAQLRISGQETAVKQRYKAARQKLDEAQVAIRDKARGQWRAINEHYTRQYHEFSTPWQRAVTELQQQHKQVTDQTHALRDQRAACQANCHTLERRLADDPSPDFRTYLRQALLGSVAKPAESEPVTLPLPVPAVQQRQAA